MLFHSAPPLSTALIRPVRKHPLSVTHPLLIQFISDLELIVYFFEAYSKRFELIGLQLEVLRRNNCIHACMHACMAGWFIVFCSSHQL